MTDYTVSSKAELLGALSKASGGDVIKMTGGNYGTLDLKNLSFSSNVTLTSNSASNPASFSGMNLSQVNGLALDGVVFDYISEKGVPAFARPFVISGCKNIEIRNSTFDGDAAKGVSVIDDGSGSGTGLAVDGSSGIVVENNAIFGFMRGITVSSSDDIVVSENNIHSLRSDGMDFAAVTNVKIIGNWIHDFRSAPGSGDHADMIQFWTSGTTTPSTDILISGNTLDIGEGDQVQLLFMRNELVDQGLAGSGMFYRNILIENNVIVGNHVHGITVGETVGLTIRNNTVLHNDGGDVDGADDGVEIPSINVAVASSGVIITDNLVAAISGWSGQSGWAVSGNVLVQDQDPLAAGYYNDIFIASSLQADGGTHAYILLPGGLGAMTRAGATASQPDAADDLVAARFHVSTVQGNGAALKFDATFSTALPSGTICEWDFGDGSEVTQGPLVRHRFPAGGMYDVTLTLRLPDGTMATALLKVGIAGPKVLELGSNGHFTAYGYGSEVDLGASSTSSAYGLKLGGIGTVATVAAEHVADIAQTDEIVISGKIKADSGSSAGEVFRIHGSFIVSVTDAGELQFRYMKTGGGESTFTTRGAGLDDLSLHQFAIRIHGTMVDIKIDGVSLASGDAGAALGWGGYGLTFGEPWGGASFSGTLRSFSITTDASDYNGTGSSVVLSSDPASGSDTPVGAVDNIILIDGLTGAIPHTSGIDEVQSALKSIDLALDRFSGIENATLLGALDLNLKGDAQNNKLVGNDGDNVLDGRSGADTLIGGLGDDLYIVDDIGDRIIEGGNGGLDRVATYVSLKLADNVEQANVLGRAPVNLTGNILDNLLVGNGSSNILDGGAGADTMKGGRGSDVYVVDNPGDRVIEVNGQGLDTVRSLISYTLPNHVENGVAIGTAAVDLTGNALANLLIGNSSANVLDGGTGKDRLTGGGGADTFVFRTGSQADVVTDFEVAGSAHDVIDLRGMSAVTDFADLVANHMIEVGGVTVIKAGNGDVLSLLNVAIADLTADHFLFVGSGSPASASTDIDEVAAEPQSVAGSPASDSSADVPDLFAHLLIQNNMMPMINAGYGDLRSLMNLFGADFAAAHLLF